MGVIKMNFITTFSNSQIVISLLHGVVSNVCVIIQ